MRVGCINIDDLERGYMGNFKQDMLSSSLSRMIGELTDDLESANQANMLASRSSDSASEADKWGEKLFLSIAGIHDNTRDMNNEVLSISKYALQIQILSINANVEAAHLGDIGTGFAIVANEMCQLAETTESSNSKVLKMLAHFKDKITAAHKKIKTTKKTLHRLKKNSLHTAELTSKLQTSIKKIISDLSSSNEIYQVEEEKFRQAPEEDKDFENKSKYSSSMTNSSKFSMEEQVDNLYINVSIDVSNAQDAFELSKKSVEIAESRITEVEQMVSEIAMIVSDADEIAKTVSIVTKIAHDAHLLSLNAAIESARVGSTGQAFSVLSSEMRGLSESIREAAFNSGEMLNKSVELVNKSNSMGRQLLELIELLQMSAELVVDFTSRVNDAMGRTKSDLQELQLLLFEKQQIKLSSMR